MTAAEPFQNLVDELHELDRAVQGRPVARDGTEDTAHPTRCYTVTEADSWARRMAGLMNW
mgnify:CR=1 FL=1